MTKGSRPKKRRPLSKGNPEQSVPKSFPTVIGSEKAKNIPPELMEHLTNMGASRESFVPPSASPIPPIRGKRPKVKVSSKVTDVTGDVPGNVSNITDEIPANDYVEQDEYDESAEDDNYDYQSQPPIQQPPIQQPPIQQPPIQQPPIQQPPIQQPPIQQPVSYVQQKPAHIRRFVGQLPSKGIPYRSVGAYVDGRIDICPMTTKEESLLYSPGDSLAHINKILDSCIVDDDKAKLSPIDLTINDRFAVLLYIRTFSYGSEYEIPFTCASCNYYNPKTIIDISSDLSMNFMDEDAEEPFEVDLPRSGDYIHFRLLRGRDEETIAKYAKRLKMQSTDEGDPSNIYRLALSIVGINGMEVSDFDAKVEYVKNMIAGDANTLRLAIQNADGRIDTTLFIDCPACGFANRFEMPFTAEFFRPSR